MIIRLSSIGFVILLSSCATTMPNYYPQTVSSWSGGKSTQLIKQWGIPDQKIVLNNGHVIYLYKTTRYTGNHTSYAPAISINYQHGRPILVSSPNPNFLTNRANSTVECVTLFEADASGKIINQQMKGPNCYANKVFADQRSNITH